LRAILGDNLIASPHGAHRTVDRRAAGIFEAFAWTQRRLLTDNAIPAHFLNIVSGVGDDPVATHKLRADFAGVGDRDRVGEHISIVLLIRLVGQEGRFGVNREFIFLCRHNPYFNMTSPMKNYRIAPSILSADFAKLGEEVNAVIAAGADIVHFDVMDNHYVPNLTIGPLVCEAVRRITKAPIDVHLMVKPVDRIIPDFAKAGANIISFHPEASDHIDRTIGLIKEHGCKAGLVFNPATPLNYLDHVIDKLDLVLIMSVNPGFGGQSFIPEALNKLRLARQRIDASGRDIWLEIDGGVKVDNIAEIAAAGADTFVAGSAIYGKPNYKAVIDSMRRELAKVGKVSC
jgi:ribulose-phosphate 3-epimerase